MPIYAHKSRRPVLGDSVYLAPSATVIGDVVLGEQSSVWFGAVVRGDVFPIRVGKRTNIQDNAIVHVTGGKSKTTVGDDVTVGHLAIVHGCTIGDRCLVGMGSIVLDDAVIGDECLIAAGALVAPRVRVPPRSLFQGRPGRVVRSLEDAEIAMIHDAAAHYVAYAADYRDHLQAV
jgi:gamma-carbonic anhydrase